MQSSVYVGPRGVPAIVPVTGAGESSVVATAIAVYAPSRQETKEAFAEVSSAI